jgi:tryptophanyl-tRNA synthetase
MKRILSGIQPTNRLHLGNYLGAIKNWVELQKQYECIFLSVNLHAITAKQDPKILHEETLRTLATYIAAGIDPKKSALVIQSQIPEHTELAWVLICHTYMGELNRMTQYKDKSAKAGTNIPCGLFVYPVLMASDILLYQSHLVPVGEDQKQHIELTRDLAGRMNRLYGEDLFTIPEPWIPSVGARIMSLQDPTAKMSKSDPNPAASIFLSDTDDEILKKLKKAVTDSGTEITDDPKKPGIRNLLTIQSAITGKSISDLVQSYAGKMYGHLKIDTAEIITETLRPIREKTELLMSDRQELEKTILESATKARSIAAKTLKLVYERVGL